MSLSPVKKSLLLPLLLTALLMSACASVSQPQLPIVIEPAKLPPLPDSAKPQSRPSICQPSCFDGLKRTRETRERWLDSQSVATPQSPTAVPATVPPKQ